MKINMAELEKVSTKAPEPTVPKPTPPAEEGAAGVAPKPKEAPTPSPTEKIDKAPGPAPETKWFFDKDKDKDTITDPVIKEIIGEMMEKFTRRLEMRPEIAGDHHRLNELYRDLEREIERIWEQDQRKDHRIGDKETYFKEASRFQERILGKLRPLEEKLGLAGPRLQPAPGGKTWIEEDIIGRQIDLEELKNLKPKLGEKIQQIRDLAAERKVGLRDLERFYNELSGLIGQDNITEKDISPFTDKIAERIYLEEGARGVIFDVDKILKVDKDYIDETFYRLLEPVVSQPYSETRDVWQIPEQGNFSHFLSIVRRIKTEENPNLGREIAEHYYTEKEVIFASHNISYYAGYPGADCKIFQKFAQEYYTPYADEAMKDPIAETFFRCRERAIQMIKSNNKGVIPPEYVEYNPKMGKHGRNYWDKLTWELFEARVEAGRVFKEITKDEAGNITRVALTEKDLAQLKLRIEAADEKAKGFAFVSIRALEIFSSTGLLGLRSTPYEGMGRYVNPIIHWFDKFFMGDIIHRQFFYTLITGKDPATWDPSQMDKIYELMQEGEDALKREYGEDAMTLAGIINFLGISGRLGPDSQWGLKAPIMTWDEHLKEYMGAGLQMAMIKQGDKIDGMVKEDHVVARYKQKFAAEKGLTLGTEKFKKAWRDEGEPKYRGQIYKEWTKIQFSPAIDKENEARTSFELLKVWLRMANDAPLIVAQEVKTGGKPLRQRLLEDLLGIPPGDLADESIPIEKKTAWLKAISQLEGDIASVQDIVPQEQRHIKKEDFDIIKDPERRKRAISYWEKCKQALVGKDDPLAVVEEIDNRWQDLDKILEERKEASAGVLTKGLVNKEFPYLLTTEDVPLREMSFTYNGGRAFARRANDFFNEVEAVFAVGTILDNIIADPDMKELLKAFGDFKKATTGYDVDVAFKGVYRLQKTVDRIYKGAWWATKVPGGQLLARIFPASAAARRFGKEKGAVWNANKGLNFIDELVKHRYLPASEFIEPGKRYRYNAERAKKEEGNTEWHALAEMLGIGLVMAMALTAFAAAQKSLEEENKKRE